MKLKSYFLENELKPFSDRDDKKAHSKFLDWTEKKPDGFVISVRDKNHLMLHYGKCGHLVWKSRPDYSMTKHLKVCSINREKLEQWANNNYGNKMKLCLSCKF